MSYQIVIRGDEAIIRRLGQADVAAVFEKVAERHAGQIQTTLATYPAAPPSSTYRRTGTLGRAWTIGRGLMMRSVGNNTTYAPYVQDRAQQAWMHQGRWATAQDTAEKHVNDLAADVAGELVKALS